MRTRRRFGASAGTGIAVLMLCASAAFAEVEYPYCVTVSGGWGAGFTSCGFTTMEQCRATAQGDGGWCHVNPAFASGADRRHQGRASRDPAQRR